MTSYRISKSLPFERMSNVILRRCFENGLYDKALVWSNNLNDALFGSHETEEERDEIFVKLDAIFSVFILYLVGMLISFIVFATEIFMGLREKKKITKT